MPRRKPAVTLNFFPQGDDLPLFSGAPALARQRPFVAQPVTAQAAFFDLRPDPFALRNEEFPVAPALAPAEEDADA
jgi:hypothetical protein